MGSELSSQRRIPGQKLVNKQQQQQQRQIPRDLSQESQGEGHEYQESGLSKPIGSTSGHSNNNLQVAQRLPVSPSRQTNLPKEIVIVSRGDTEEDTKKFTFPPPFKPLIPIGHETLPPTVFQINPNLLVDITCLLQRELNRKALFVASQQNTLCLIIKDIEAFSIYLNINILSEKNKRFVKIVDNFSKLNDIEILISKVDQDLDLCVSRLNLLNNSLPESVKLPDLPLDSAKHHQKTTE